MPIDSGLMQKLNEAIGNLITDPVQDVSYAANQLVGDLGHSSPHILIGNGQFNDKTLDDMDHQKELEEYGDPENAKKKKEEEGNSVPAKVVIKKIKKKPTELDVANSSKKVNVPKPKLGPDETTVVLKKSQAAEGAVIQAKNVVKLNPSTVAKVEDPTMDKKTRIRVKMPPTTVENTVKRASIPVVSKKEVSLGEKDEPKTAKVLIGSASSRHVKTTSKTSRVMT
jgi:hypothetical protein